MSCVPHLLFFYDELLLWLRGRYRSYTDYDLEVVGLLPPR